MNEDVFAYSNRAGDERGIVLYHNRYAATSGWIRTSAAMAVTNDQGETILVQKSLGEALGFNPDGRCYYAFRDSISGLEYLRAGRELCEQGLHAELASYEYRVFLDFREIVDDDYGIWGKLCHALQGRPVTSIDEEVKQVRYEVVIERFRAAASETARLLAAEKCAREELENGGLLLERFFEELNRHTACTGDSRALASEAVREIEGARRLAALAAEKESAADRTADGLLRAAWLVLHGTGKLALVEEHAPVAAAWFAELGLDRAFAGLVRETSRGAEAAAYALLLKLMIRWQGVFVDRDRKKARADFTLLFADHAVRDFLGVHTYRESEWFVKERFELLMERLLDVARIRRRRR